MHLSEPFHQTSMIKSSRLVSVFSHSLSTCEDSQRNVVWVNFYRLWVRSRNHSKYLLTSHHVLNCHTLVWKIAPQEPVVNAGAGDSEGLFSTSHLDIFSAKSNANHLSDRRSILIRLSSWVKNHSNTWRAISASSIVPTTPSGRKTVRRSYKE